jgi:tRNA threonylcarbamoyladenosine biosynthesis protein TsaE
MRAQSAKLWSLGKSWEKYCKRVIMCALQAALGREDGLTGGIAAGLGIGGYITSPTFTIVNEYEGRLPLYHFDVYRIESPGRCSIRV